MDEELKNQNILTASALEDQPSADFRTAEPEFIPRIDQSFIEQPGQAELDKQQATGLTGTEQQVQSGVEEMAKLNKMLIGESEFRTAEEEKQELPALLQTQTDLQNRIKTLAAEQQSIPLQIQQESIGRGRTRAGVEPIQTARLRENAINALSTSALLQATQGNISTAQTLADRAVAAKFDPVREKLDVMSDNLQLIIDSPQFSAEQKKRAEKQAEIVAQNKKEATRQETEMKGINDIAVETAKFGASLEVLQAIRDSKSVLEATAIAQTTGLYDVDKMQQEFENSLKTGEFNLKKQELQNKITQQAFDQDLSIMSFELDRDKFTTDTEFKNAQLALDRMKANYTVDKIQADIDKIYDDIKNKGELTLDDQIKINKLREEKTKKEAAEVQKKISLNNESETIQDDIGMIDKLINRLENPLTDVGVVGANPLARWNPLEALTGADNDFIGNVNHIVSQETLNALTGLKARGGTLGAISEKELAILQSSATKFDSWAARDKDGNFKGYWDISEKTFAEELKRVKEARQRMLDAVEIERASITPAYETMEDLLKDADDGQLDAMDNLKQTYPTLTDEEILDFINEKARGSSFSQVGGDTEKALPQEVIKAKVGEEGGQCGRFVNNATGLGVGDSYESKISKMDSSITEPEPGMVFTMPYKDTGHTGFVVGVEGNDVIVKDSNWSLDEKVRVHKIPKFKITGYKRV